MASDAPAVSERNGEPRQMNEATGLRMSHVEDHREKAREVILRHGENAKDYVTARIEACETAGEEADAANWRQVLDALSEAENAHSR